MIYTDIVEYNIVGDTPLLQCFPLISKVKSGEVITTVKYMNYQTFSNLQIRKLLKNSFHSVQGEPLRLELNFDTALEHVTEVIVLGERMSSVAVDRNGVVGKNIQ